MLPNVVRDFVTDFLLGLDIWRMRNNALNVLLDTVNMTNNGLNGYCLSVLASSPHRRSIDQTGCQAR